MGTKHRVLLPLRPAPSCARPWRFTFKCDIPSMVMVTNSVYPINYPNSVYPTEKGQACPVPCARCQVPASLGHLCC